MPIYRITAPNGKTYRIEGPPGASDADVANAVMAQFPESGHVPPELPDSIYRELYVRPCRIFYRNEDDVVLILHVMREERQLRKFLLDPERDS
jgi:plasmid stabilization system protein ParE